MATKKTTAKQARKAASDASGARSASWFGRRSSRCASRISASISAPRTHRERHTMYAVPKRRADTEDRPLRRVGGDRLKLPRKECPGRRLRAENVVADVSTGAINVREQRCERYIVLFQLRSQLRLCPARNLPLAPLVFLHFARLLVAVQRGRTSTSPNAGVSPLMRAVTRTAVGESDVVCSMRYRVNVCCPASRWTRSGITRPAIKSSTF
jgi:hypothetical protein